MKILICALLAAGVAAGQNRTAVQDSPGSNLPAHRIGANDLLSIAVYDAPELTRTVRVSDEGLLRLPMLKEPIRTAGMLPGEVEVAIAAALEREQILVAPVVTVTVAEYHSRPISVAGAVKTPVTFQAVGPLRLLDAIAHAVCLTDDAGAEILVTRADSERGGARTQRIAVKALLNAASPELNVGLRGGEEITVPAIGRVFVVGNVRKPGAFALREGSEGTVMQMLALAEGLTSFSAKQAWLYRRGADGTRREIPVELSQIMQRRHADVAVLADDILYIPENRGRRLSVAALERVLVFGSTAGATALVYGGVR
jgi:polysaccharide export outer membrane protein